MPYVEARHHMYGGELLRQPDRRERSGVAGVWTSDTASATSSRDYNQATIPWLDSASSSRPIPQELAGKRRSTRGRTHRHRPTFQRYARPGRRGLPPRESAYVIAGPRRPGSNKPNPNLGEVGHSALLWRQDGSGRPGTMRYPHRCVNGRRNDGSTTDGLTLQAMSVPQDGTPGPGSGRHDSPAMTFGYLAALHTPISVGKRWICPSTLDRRAGCTALARRILLTSTDA